jgi:hypothetical protein
MGGYFSETDFTICRTVILPGMQGLHSFVMESYEVRTKASVFVCIAGPFELYQISSLWR